MTRDEGRKLLGGYATGSLTELERQLLFDAALDDQELFDELADEQALKELIELPGAKRRLLEALGPETSNRAWWAQPWPWAAAAVLAAVSVTVWLLVPKNEARIEIAQTVEAPIPSAANQNAVPPPATVQPAPKAESPAPVTLEKSATETAAATAAQPPAQAKELAEARLAAPAAAPKPALALRDSIRITGQPAAQGFLATDSAVQAPATVPTGDALTYEVKDTGFLRIVPARAGVLEIMAGTRTLFPSNPVIAGTPIELSIPLDVQQLRIDFAGAANAPPVTAVRSEATSGTLVMPASPNPRAVITIPAQR